MKILARVFIIIGLLFLCIAGIYRFILGRPFALLGVKTLSLIVLANTALLLAVLIKVCEKK